MSLSKMTKKEIIEKVKNSLAYAKLEYSFKYNDMDLLEYTDLLKCFEWILEERKRNGKNLSSENGS